MPWLWVFIALAALLAAASLLGDRKRLDYVRRLADPPPALDCPPATVIVPVKGQDQGLADNLKSLSALDYPDFELIVVVRDAADLPPGVLPPSARLVVSRTHPSLGAADKIENLIAAVRAARPASRILAFADSDGRVRPAWLRGLVAALVQPGAGAASGYRWHIPPQPSFAGLLRSGWNAVVAGGFGPGDNRFAWGGAMALRRETFEKANVEGYWKGAVSDDYRLSEAVHDAGLHIVFAPPAMVAAVDSTGLAEFLSWSRRQLTITRIYSPRLWRMALAGHIVYCLAMVASASMAASGSLTAAAALLWILTAGVLKEWNRLAAARTALPQWRELLHRDAAARLALTPLVTWVWMLSLLLSALSPDIHWRGRRYRLVRLPRPAINA